MPDVCEGFVVYENMTAGVSGIVTFEGQVQQFHETLSSYFDLGYGCGDLRPAYDQYIDPATSPWWSAGAKGTYVKNGQVFPTPSVDIVYPSEGVTSWTLNSTPLSLGVTFELRVRIGGVWVSRGTIDYGYLVNAPEKDPDNVGALITWRTYSANNLTGAFPIVIGQGGVEGIGWGFGPYQGSDKPWTGSVEYVYPQEGGPDIIYNATFVDSTTGNAIWQSSWSTGNIPSPDCVATFQIPSGTNDVEAFWCCLSAGHDCCSPSPGIVSQAFLIPRPNSPAPAEQNISTPVLKTPLYLSNHTFQFNNDLGKLS